MKATTKALNPAEEAAHELRKREAIASAIISLLILCLIALGLAMITIHLVQNQTELINARIPTESTDKPTRDTPKPALSRKKPSPPATAAPKVINTVSIAPIAFPSKIQSPDIPFDAGNGAMVGLGGSFGGIGDGSGGKKTDFGYTDAQPGTLLGKLYDFKQDAEGNAVDYSTGNAADFTSRITDIQRADFSDRSLKNFFQAPRELFLTHLAVPFSNASSGPSYFGAEESIKPSGWMAHYHGRIVAPKTGRYRFVGIGDDYLAVFTNNRPRLIAAWSDIQNAVAGRWKPSEPTGKFASPFSGMRLVYGDWISMREGQAIDIDIAAGERPGGKVGFILMIEEKGRDYRTAPDGRPILPLFTTTEFTLEDRETIESNFSGFEFEWENVPVFPADARDDRI